MSARKESLLTRLRRSSAPFPQGAAAGAGLDAGPTPASPNTVSPREHDELTVFIVAGEHSGDALGAGLMAELDPAS